MTVKAPVAARFMMGLLLSVPTVKNSSALAGPYSIDVPMASDTVMAT